MCQVFVAFELYSFVLFESTHEAFVTIKIVNNVVFELLKHFIRYRHTLTQCVVLCGFTVRTNLRYEIRKATIKAKPNNIVARYATRSERRFDTVESCRSKPIASPTTVYERLWVGLHGMTRRNVASSVLRIRNLMFGLPQFIL